MFNDFNTGPRNWKWMVPAVFIAPLWIWFTLWWTDEAWSWLAMIPLCFSGIALLATVINLWLYVQRRWADMYADVQVARNSTPEVRMMEAAKSMHPETVKALLAHRRTTWRIKYVARKDLTDWVLDEAPTVHAGFVDFVLDNSNGVSLMPKHRLSEGSMKLDPEGIVSDYQQYDDLLLLLQQKLMVTEAFGNQAPHFLPPWNVDTLRKRFGLVGGGEYQIENDEVGMVASHEVPGDNPHPQPFPLNGGRENVIDKALEGLEQTSQMRARTAQMYKGS